MSGAQFTIAAHDHVAVVTEVGATLRSLSVAGAPVIDGFGATAMCEAGRGQVLAPWPNRLADGAYSFGGIEGKAPLDEPERSCAIHGLVRWLPWSLVRLEPASVQLACILHPQPAYPFRLALTITYAVGKSGLAVTIDAQNSGAGPLPLGVGFHPYLTVAATGADQGHAPGLPAPTDAIDDWELHLPGAVALTVDARGLPTGRTAVARGPLDYTVARRIGGTVLDTAFTDLARGANGIAQASLCDPVHGRQVTLWVDQSFSYLMCFTGDTLASDARRRAVAIEPMTCPPNALATGESLIRLAPGEAWSARWGISAS